MTNDRQEELIQKYLNKQCTDQELTEVLELLKTAPGKKIMERWMQKAVEEIDLEGSSTATDVSQEIQLRVLQTIRTNKRIVQRRTLLRVAASVLLVITIGIFSYYFGTSVKDSVLAANQKHIEVEIGKVATLQLADGTTIKVKGGSTIHYATHFTWLSQRKLTLQGEAYFEVAKDSKKPFIIHTEKAQIQVIGTAFNVKESVGKNTVVVAVTEGRVSFKSKIMAKNIYLQQNEVGILQSDGDIRSEVSESSNYTNWFSGRLTFNDMPLKEVVKQLERIYDVNIKLENKNLNNLIFTADMKVNTIAAVMEQIALSLQLKSKYDKTRNIYFLQSGK
jgi:ferric-dicitrate binding protein FerR (iron transport regulator)